MSNITETKICVEKLLPHHQEELNSIKNSNLPSHHIQRLQAAFYTRKLWPTNSKIRIAFLEEGDQIPRTNLSNKKDVDPLQQEVKNLTIQEAVKKVVNERIIPLVNLDIAFVDNSEEANVRISFDSDGGAWSLVGTDHLEEDDGATMNLGWFDVPTTIHEFCHMLGMIHEHSNMRGNSIKWDDAKVYEWAKETQGWSKETTDENILKKYDKSQINGSNFDPLSVMLYFFPAYLTTNNKGTNQNLRFSGKDTLWITKMYPVKNGVSAEVSAEDFYESTYDESLEDSINESERLSSSSSSKSNNIWIWIIIIVIIIVIIVAFLYLKNRKK